MIDDVRRALNRPPSALDPTRGLSAVAAILDPDLNLLLIRRAERDGDPWSGHVSFPGGRMEATDADPLAAAVRETHEEIGLVLPQRSVLGQLDDVAAVGGRSGMIVRPFVFRVDAFPPVFVPNTEVQSIHTLSLALLLRDEGRSRMAWDYRGQVLDLPRVDFDGLRLWGLTLRMVDDLLHRIDGRGIGLARLRSGSAGQ